MLGDDDELDVRCLFDISVLGVAEGFDVGANKGDLLGFAVLGFAEGLDFGILPLLAVLGAAKGLAVGPNEGDQYLAVLVH